MNRYYDPYKPPPPPLQAILNALARAVTKASEDHHITPVFKLFHWFKILERIEHKAVSPTYH